MFADVMIVSDIAVKFSHKNCRFYMNGWILRIFMLLRS